MPERFELTPRNQVYPDSELIADIQRIARRLGRAALSRKEYTANGRYDGDNIAKRFGGWKHALERAGLASPQRMPATSEELLDDLRRVARELGSVSLSLAQYRSAGRFSEHPFREHFGSWSEAIRRSGIAPPPGYRARIPNEEYFRNLEQVWITLGRQPRFTEMDKPLSRYSVKAYEHRFGSWRKALEAFVEYANQTDDAPVTSPPRAPRPAPQRAAAPQEPKPRTRQRTKRVPSHRLRFQVMKRDKFKCRACGRSPALDHAVLLHVDHVTPWDAGGETVLDNLQTLCETCNLGKSNQVP